MHKNVLSEQALYYGDVTMPKNWDIDREKIKVRYFTNHK